MSTPLKITLKEIESITNNFSDENIIGKGFLGNNYKGRLSLSESEKEIDVAVRRLDRSFCLQEVAFDKEITVLSSLKHDNIVSMVGFCYENNEMIIVNKREALGSLYRHLSNPKLTWMRRLNISVGVASALWYLHNGGGRNASVVHHNVNSTSILLNEKWEAKLSGFEYSMTIPAARDLDVAYEKLGIGTYKSDVYSFGIVLFEILCGAKAFTSNDDGSFQASLAIFQYENRKLHEFVDPDLLRQMNQQSFNIFSAISCYCLKEPRSPPNMNQVLKRLKRALEFQHKHENPEHSTVVLERTLPSRLILKLKNLEQTRIQLKDIMLATDNFSSDKLIVSGGYGTVYSGKLHHVDRGYCFNIEGENECEVAIKRISDPEDEVSQEGFYAEIEMLTKCKHSNIIALLGFCDEGSSMILVYEYCPNKSLVDYLLSKSNLHNDSWAQRIRICLGVANGLNCLHTSEGPRPEIVHRDIKSANILLGKNLDAKIGDFGLSTFVSLSEELNTLYYTGNAGTKVYMDPQYAKDKKLKIEIDVYSFGVVLFEILCGRLAYDPLYTLKNRKGIAVIARQHFDSGRTIMEMVDPKIKEGTTETIFTSVIGPNQDSVDTFSKVAYQCLTKSQANRPTMEFVIKELQKALLYQENRKDIFQAPLSVIKSVTENFNDSYCIGSDGYWKVYRGKVSRASGHTSIDVKRLDTITSRDETEKQFLTELKILMEYKHDNVIGLVGYCDEKDEKIIVYEHASLGSLDTHLKDSSLTWAKRLKICIDIASGLDFLHGGLVTEEIVIHRDIKSSNILLDGEMKAKIAGFGFALIRSINQDMVFSADTIAGTYTYIDPQYASTGLLSKECDIYSFGVVLFEIMFRTFAYFNLDDHFGPMIKDLYKKGKLDDMVFEGTKEQIAPQPLTIFKRIAIQCLHDIREERPTAAEVVIQLKKALEIQEKGMDIIRISFEDIKSATDNFSSKRCIGGGGFGKVFKGLFPHANGQKIIAAKQLDTVYGQGDREFYQELEILFKFKHKNVVGLEGYCEEKGERIIVYEYASKGSLDRWLNKDDLTWMKRLEICIDIATGLDFLHGGFLRQEAVVHRDVKSGNILLSGDWKAKITDFGLSLISPINQEMDYLIEDVVGALGYADPVYVKTNIVRKASDIYSFGVVLFEILCGRLAFEGYNIKGQRLLGRLAKDYYAQGKIDEIVFEGVKEQIGPKSLTTFADIAYQCLHDDQKERPSASEVLIQLKKALEFQEDYEIWEPKLPTDYKRIVQMSKSPEINFNKKKRDLCDMFSEGILLRGGKVSLSLDNNGRRNEMISARIFSYKDHRWQKWRLLPISRFHRVSMMLDISNLMIQIKIKTQFLSPDVVYGVHLIVKFGDPKKVPSKLMYVDLKYKKGNETMHAYFAEQRDDEWMQIELFRFFNHKEETDFEVLLESFSKYYCGSGVIYIEGIEFRTIDNVKLEEMDKVKEIQQVLRSNSNSLMGKVHRLQMHRLQVHRVSTYRGKKVGRPVNHSEKLLSLSEMNGRKCCMLSARGYCSNKKLSINLKPSQQSRFRKVIELPSLQVFCIRYKIESQMLSPDTDYTCYLVFKLSEECRGLHCPVKVRNLIHRNNKEIETLYFRSPTPWNLNDIKQAPRRREDDWMEVSVWKFNSKVDQKNHCIPINLKFISYEGTMAGLIVYRLEFRPT